MAKKNLQLVDYASEGSTAFARVKVGSKTMKVDLPYQCESYNSYMSVDDVLSRAFTASTPKELAEAIDEMISFWDVDDDCEFEASKITKKNFTKLKRIVNAVAKAQALDDVSEILASTVEDEEFTATYIDFASGRGVFYKDSYGDESLHIVEKAGSDLSFDRQKDIDSAFPDLQSFRKDMFCTPPDYFRCIVETDDWPK